VDALLVPVFVALGTGTHSTFEFVGVVVVGAGVVWTGAGAMVPLGLLP
jgi:hypothetical protein